MSETAVSKRDLETLQDLGKEVPVLRMDGRTNL